MTITRLQPHDTWLRLDLSPLAAPSGGDAFLLLCQANPDLRFERLASGEIVVKPPAGAASGHRNAAILAALWSWARADGTGVVFDASAGFRLPDGAVRAPDVAWVRHARISGLSAPEKERFLALCPDLVIEVRSPSDALSELRARMDEYIANGARLGWLIDPRRRTLFVYRSGVPAERLVDPASVAADPELPGFVLDLAPIWGPGF